MQASERSVDKAAQEIIERMAELGQQNAWDRLEAQLPQCGFGKQGICCRICSMGPCRVTLAKTTSGLSQPATAISSRNTSISCHSPLYSYWLGFSGLIRSMNRSWTSGPRLVTPQAMCSLWPMMTPGVLAKVLPTTL